MTIRDAEEIPSRALRRVRRRRRLAQYPSRPERPSSARLLGTPPRHASATGAVRCRAGVTYRGDVTASRPATRALGFCGGPGVYGGVGWPHGAERAAAGAEGAFSILAGRSGAGRRRQLPDPSTAR